MILSKIIEEKRASIEKAKAALSQDDIKKRPRGSGRHRGFEKAISRAQHINLIAEIKKASPSKGLLRRDFEPARIASQYGIAGAAALSILTEEKFFLGSLDHVREVKKVTELPILRKDFIVDPYQLYESSFYGADAVLLIADILSEEELKHFYGISKKLGLDVVIEVHNEEDLKKALDVEARIIGINNRDLHTFNVDLGVTTRLIKAIPEDRIVISESGIKTHEDIMFLRSIGVKAVLIGEAFMVAGDIAAKAKELMGR